MESRSDFDEIKVGEQPVTTGVNVQPPGTMVSKPQVQISDKPWEEWVEPILRFLDKLPEEVGEFFSDYKKPLLTILTILSGIVTVYITVAVLDAINDIPLLSPLLELVGLSFTGWFVYRYLLRESTRKELIAEFNALKAQVMGRNSIDL